MTPTTSASSDSARVMALVLGVLVGSAVLVTWPLATCPASCLPANLGDPLLNTWIVGWGSERLLDGLRGFWDAPIFHRPVNEWLARQEPGPVLALPIALENFAAIPSGGETLALHYQYSTLHHRQPLVNGSSGFQSPLTSWLEGPGSPFGEMPASVPSIVDMLRTLGVRYIVVHTDDYWNEDLATAVVAGFRELEDSVQARGQFGPKYAFELEPTTREPATLAVGTPTRAFDVSSSHSTDAVGSLVDRNPTTRWRGGDSQDGDEWLKVRFREPTLVSGIRLALGNVGMQEYPRRLEIWVERDGERRKVFGDHVLHLLAEGILEDPVGIWVTIALEVTTADALSIEQTGRSQWPWSVAELEILSPLTP